MTKRRVIALIGPGKPSWNKQIVTDLVHALLNQGADVVCCGDGVNPLSESELEETLNWINKPDETQEVFDVTLFIIAHGKGYSDQQHTVNLKGDDCLTNSADLFTEITKRLLTNQSIDIISAACYGDAMIGSSFLPKGSIYISLAPKQGETDVDDVEKMIRRLKYPNVVNYGQHCKLIIPKNCLSAEAMLVVYLIGLHVYAAPSISSAKISIDLKECLKKHTGVKFEIAEIEYIHSNLSHWLPINDLDRLIKTIESERLSINEDIYGLALAICYAATGKMTLKFNEHEDCNLIGRKIAIIPPKLSQSITQETAKFPLLQGVDFTVPTDTTKISSVSQINNAQYSKLLTYNGIFSTQRRQSENSDKQLVLSLMEKSGLDSCYATNATFLNSVIYSEIQFPHGIEQQYMQHIANSFTSAGLDCFIDQGGTYIKPHITIKLKPEKLEAWIHDSPTSEFK
jgi:hypothetical protein